VVLHFDGPMLWNVTQIGSGFNKSSGVLNVADACMWNHVLFYQLIAMFQNIDL
jgi:hypothetical protein